MSATKILWGQILVVFAIVLTTIWAATQWTAWRLGYTTKNLFRLSEITFDCTFGARQ